MATIPAEIVSAAVVKVTGVAIATVVVGPPVSVTVNNTIIKNKQKQLA